MAIQRSDIHLPKWMQKRYFGYHLYLKIAEPRIFRVLQFGVYACLITVGAGLVMNPPRGFQTEVGPLLVIMVGSFISLGAFVGLLAVLPGIWWLERVGLILLGTGLGMYFVIVTAQSTSLVGGAVALGFLLTFIQRWMEIRAYQLAPLDPKLEE